MPQGMEGSFRLPPISNCFVGLGTVEGTAASSSVMLQARIQVMPMGWSWAVVLVRMRFTASHITVNNRKERYVKAPKVING